MPDALPDVSSDSYRSQQQTHVTWETVHTPKQWASAQEVIWNNGLTDRPFQAFDRMLQICRRCTAVKNRTVSLREFPPCVSWCAGKLPGRRGWGWGSRGCGWWSGRGPGPRHETDLPPSSNLCRLSPSDWSPATIHYKHTVITVASRRNIEICFLLLLLLSSL